jgi:hypothetical protein
MTFVQNSVYKVLLILSKELSNLYFVMILRRLKLRSILEVFVRQTTYEPYHDKTNIVLVRPAWIHTSLRIRAVSSGWSGCMLVANVLCWFCQDAAHFVLDLAAYNVLFILEICILTSVRKHF